MDIKGVLDLYYRGQFYVFPEEIHTTARGSTITIHTADIHGATNHICNFTPQFQWGPVVLVNLIGY